MTADIVPFPQRLSNPRRADLSGPCVVLVLPVVRIERHTEDRLVRGICLTCGDFITPGVACESVSCQVVSHGICKVDMTDAPFGTEWLDEVKVLSDDAFDACVFHFKSLNDALTPR